MGLTKASEFLQLPAKKSHTKWLLWIDDNIWGYALTRDDAIIYLNKIADSIVTELQEEESKWQINKEYITENIIKITCLHQGYVYNSCWTAHTIKFDSIYMLNNLSNLENMSRSEIEQLDTKIPLVIAPKIINIRDGYVSEKAI